MCIRDSSSDTHINVGTGQDLSIRSLADVIRTIVHPDAELVFDTSKPDGMPRKVLSVEKLEQMGWKHTIELSEGVAATYQWFIQHQSDARGM